MAQRDTIIYDSSDKRLSILQDLYDGNSSPQKAADALASISLSTSSDLGVPLGRTWDTIIVAAREKPEHQDKLVDVLATLARLPDAKNEQGKPLFIYDMRVWSDLPTLGRELNYEWNGNILLTVRINMSDTTADYIFFIRFHRPYTTRS